MCNTVKCKLDKLTSFLKDLKITIQKTNFIAF